MKQQILAGKYNLLNILSSGGMGEVWEAEDIESREKLAVKKIHEKARKRDVGNLLRSGRKPRFSASSTTRTSSM